MKKKRHSTRSININGFLFHTVAVRNGIRYMRCGMYKRYNCKASAKMHVDGSDESAKLVHEVHNHEIDNFKLTEMEFKKALREEMRCNPRSCKSVYNDVAKKHKKGASIVSYSSISRTLARWKSLCTSESCIKNKKEANEPSFTVKTKLENLNRKSCSKKIVINDFFVSDDSEVEPCFYDQLNDEFLTPETQNERPVISDQQNSDGSGKFWKVSKMWISTSSDNNSTSLSAIDPSDNGFEEIQLFSNILTSEAEQSEGALMDVSENADSLSESNIIESNEDEIAAEELDEISDDLREALKMLQVQVNKLESKIVNLTSQLSQERSARYNLQMLIKELARIFSINDYEEEWPKVMIMDI